MIFVSFEAPTVLLHQPETPTRQNPAAKHRKGAFKTRDSRRRSARLQESKMEVSKNWGHRYSPKTIGVLSKEHPPKGAPICRHGAKSFLQHSTLKFISHNLDLDHPKYLYSGRVFGNLWHHQRTPRDYPTCTAGTGMEAMSLYQFKTTGFPSSTMVVFQQGSSPFIGLPAGDTLSLPATVAHCPTPAQNFSSRKGEPCTKMQACVHTYMDIY